VRIFGSRKGRKDSQQTTKTHCGATDGRAGGEQGGSGLLADFSMAPRAGNNNGTNNGGDNDNNGGNGNQMMGEQWG